MVCVGAALALSASLSGAAAFAGRRDISGLDLHAALARASWAPVVVAVRSSTAFERRVMRGLQDDDFRLTRRWSEIPAFAGRVSRTGLAKLTADPDVLRVDLDAGGRAHDLQSLPLINGDAVHARGYLGAGATVAVLDSGVEASDPDLAGRVVGEHCFCTNADGSGCCPGGAREATGPGSALDDNGHGTSVTGIIASGGFVAPRGVAAAARIVAVKVLAADGSFAWTSQVISGLNWVMANHPEVKVVNLSLGTSALYGDTCDSATASTLSFASAISVFRSRGGLVFVSTGNDGVKNAMSAPACISGAVSVGAVYDEDVGVQTFAGAKCTDAATRADQATCFSNSSPALDLLAPGALITSTGLGAEVSTYAGTSQACPHAAGAAAVLFGAASSPAVAPSAIEEALETSGKGITDAANGRSTPRVDLEAALDLIGRHPRIEVRPLRLDFTRIRARRSAVRQLTIRNVGDRALSVDLPGRLSRPFSFANHPGALTVPSGGLVKLKVVFRPASIRRYEATLVISSDDASRPRVRVPLSGAGIGGG